MDDLVKMDGYDDCLIGVVERFGSDLFYLYDKSLIIEKLMKENNMSFDDANEWFEYNQIGAWVGESTPAFLVCRMEDL